MGVWFLANAGGEQDRRRGRRVHPDARREAAGDRRWTGGFIQSVSATNHGFYMIFVVAGFAAAVLMLLFVPILKPDEQRGCMNGLTAT